MKIIGICGSPKKVNSTSLFALKEALKECEILGFETEIIELSKHNFNGCIDCGFCKGKLECAQKDDFQNNILPILDDENLKGLIFASPVYFGGISSQLKSFMDRSVLFRRNGFKFENVVCGAITVGRSRNGGQELASMDIIKNALIQGMIVVPDSSPTSHFGGNLWSGNPTGIENDEAGIRTAKNLGKKVAEIAKCIK